MSRAPGGFAINDIRSTALLVEYVHKNDPFAPGAQARAKCNYSYILECGEPPCGFDTKPDIIALIAACIMAGTIIGQIHCLALFFPVVQKEYDMGFVEVCFTAALTYAVLIKSSCIGCLSIQWCGHRLTAMFGMLLIFVGILLDSQVIHYAVYYVSNIVLFGIGGGMAYTACMCIPGDVFRKNLIMGVVGTCVSGRVGTIIYYWLSLLLLSHISYKWTKVCLAILTLIITGACNVLPSFKVDEGCLKPLEIHNRNAEIKNFVEHTLHTEESKKPTKDDDLEKACLCVCVCDVSLWSDWSFILWGVCVCLATSSLFLPYMFILSYADALGIDLSPWFLTCLCFTSIVSRIVFLLGNDYTYFYNKLFFQCVIFLSGILWILFAYVETYGWLLVWCATMGIIEGIIVVLIPRLTLVTIPRRWLDHSWGYILWFHALGVAASTIFVAIVARQLHDFYVGFIAVGVFQVICALLSFLLPNEEITGCGDGKAGAGQGTGKGNSKGGGAGTGGGGGGGSGGHTSGGRYTADCRSLGMGSYIRPRSVLTGTMYTAHDFTSYFPSSSYETTTRGNCSSSFGKNYKCNCPICIKIGCIPECRDCVPGGLSQGGLTPCYTTSIDSSVPKTTPGSSTCS